VRVAKIIAELFLREDLPPFLDGYTLVIWIEDIADYTRKNAEDISRLTPYLVALFPLIKRIYATSRALCDTDHSLLLCFLGSTTDFTPLQDHIARLEAHVPGPAKRVKKVRLLTGYLQFYVRYPLSLSTQHALLEALQATPEKIKRQWMEAHHFYYAPIDRFMINAIEDYDLIFDEAEQQRIRIFIEGIGCKALLLEGLRANEVPILYLALRWAIITQDQDLFSQLLETCQRHIPDLDVLEALHRFLIYLKESDPIQAQLIFYLNKDLQKVGSENTTDRSC
jgi:hypothetical protein